MPLLDHFHAPLHPGRSWESFHSLWVAQLCGQLNVRPNRHGFLAEANVHVGIMVAADVATFEKDSPAGEGANGAVPTEVWAPPQPPLVVPVDFSNLETFEIRVYDEERARTPVAVVELVSPGNKDRPESRRAFLETRTQLETWPAALSLGTPLPTMPLWLSESLAIPLELEAAYRMACRHSAIG